MQRNYCHYNISSLFTKLPREKTAKGLCDLRVKLLLAQLSTTHGEAFAQELSTGQQVRANPKTYARTQK